MLPTRLAKLNIFLLGLLLFLIPFQTRWIYAPAFLNGGFWEYGTGSIYGSELLLSVIIILTAFDYFLNRVFWQKIKNDILTGRNIFGLASATLFLFGLIFFVLHSRFPGLSFIYISYFIEALCLSGVVALSRASWQQKVVAFWLGAFAQSVLALWQFFSQQVIANKWLGMAAQSASSLGASVIESDGGRWLRAYGSFPWPNALGIYLAVAFLFGLLLYFKLSTWPRRILLSAGQIFILFGLFFSFSRAAWLALAVGLTTVIVVWFTNKNKISALTFVRPFVFIVITGIVVSSMFWNLISPRVFVSNSLEKRSITERYEQLWEWSGIVKISPALGVGPGAYTFAKYVANQNLPAWRYQPIHNIYFLILAEWGVVASAVFLLLFLGLCRRIYVREPFLISVITAWLFFGLFDHWTISLVGGIFFSAVVFGLSVSLDGLGDME